MSKLCTKNRGVCRPCSYPTSEGTLDSSSYIIAQFFRPLHRSPDSDNLHLARRDLSSLFGDLAQRPSCARGWPACAERSARTLLPLSMRTTETDQSFRTVLSGGQRAEVPAHIAQVATGREGGPFFGGWAPICFALGGRPSPPRGSGSPPGSEACRSVEELGRKRKRYAVLKQEAFGSIQEKSAEFE